MKHMLVTQQFKLHSALLLAASLSIFRASAQKEVPWSAELYADNADYVLLKLDARKLEDNVILSGLSFTVEFYQDAKMKTSLGKQSLRVPDEVAAKFRSGVVNGAYLAHSHAGAVAVKALSLQANSDAAGGKADGLSSPKPVTSKRVLKISVKPSDLNLPAKAPPAKRPPPAR
jgi:hypothetical protein